MARVRLADVAARAGVSVSAASLVLNDKPSRISEATAEAVRRAARELDYRPDLNARSLRSRRTRTIGLVSDVITTTPFAAGIVQGVQEAAWEREHLLFIGNTGSDPVREQELVQAMSARRVDGYLYGAMYHQARTLPHALRGEAVVGVDVDLVGCTSFVPDEATGARLATRLLLSRGHRRIAHIQGRRGVIAATMRREAFEREMAAAGLVPRVESMPDDFEGFDSAFGEIAAARLLEGPDRPTAIFAFNDAMAAGVVRAALRSGLRVPEDLSLVGFDDAPFITQELLPWLSTVALPHGEMGRLAVHALIDALEGTPREPGAVLVDCVLRERGSVLPPAAG